jgi:hypothetical protein
MEILASVIFLIVGGPLLIMPVDDDRVSLVGATNARRWVGRNGLESGAGQSASKEQWTTVIGSVE